jgi:hypothetical protein
MRREWKLIVVVTVAILATLALAAGAAGQAREDIGAVPVGTVPPGPDGAPVYNMPLAMLFDNGPLVTHVGGGAGGADASRLQNSTLLMSTLGFTASTAGAFRIADNFTVPAPGWQINTITFFGYQTGSTTTSTFDTVRVQIWNGAPNGGGSIVFGDLTTNRFASTAFSNIYRDTETTVANNQRPIMATTATIGTTLVPGTYWVDFQLGGTLASGPFIPPVTVTGSNSPCTPCNAIQWSGTAWTALNDTGSATQQDVKFIIDGVALPVELQSLTIE